MEPSMSAFESSDKSCPIDDLPVELLSHIFLILKAMHALTRHERANERIHSTPYQITLSHVASRWRTIAINTPDLWTFIYVSHTHKHLERVDAFLTRSASQSLDIVIRCLQRSPGTGLSDPQKTTMIAKPRIAFGPLLSKLVTHVARWGAFNFSSDVWQIMRAELTVLQPTTAPHLRTFGLRYYDRTYRVANTHPAWAANNWGDLTPFSGAPLQLHELAVRGIPLDWQWCAFAGLRVLTLSNNFSQRRVGLSSDDALRILARCPALVSLRVEDLVPLANHATAQAVELPVLNDFDIAVVTWDSADWITQYLIAPNLRALTLWHYKSLTVEIMDVLTGAHPTTGASILRPLRVFCMVPFHAECNSDRRHLMYGQLHNLRVFIYDTDVDDTGVGSFTFLRDLMGPTGTVLPLPNLTTLVIASIDWNLMHAVVEARRDAGAPLRKVVFRTDACEEDLEQAQWFAQNLETFAFTAEDPRKTAPDDWLEFDTAVPGTAEFRDACARLKCCVY
ncbi:hypothetical protein EVG20_g1977 [Dentipellis fragilis]|uniref:Uncharacterized protein n=1 Tax=Dentipellis fragilis TaxID=205917 RepID=A0A4Y9Z833_9AGAM|nr:hypothetical protein EVG20_g1977 [Dentipellis fragilis]